MNVTIYSPYCGHPKPYPINTGNILLNCIIIVVEKRKIARLKNVLLLYNLRNCLRTLIVLASLYQDLYSSGLSFIINDPKKKQSAFIVLPTIMKILNASSPEFQITGNIIIERPPIAVENVLITDILALSASDSVTSGTQAAKEIETTVSTVSHTKRYTMYCINFIITPAFAIPG
jgi:hypothetical protein